MAMTSDSDRVISSASATSRLVDAAHARSSSRWRHSWRALRRHPLALVGLVMLVIIVLASLTAGLISPADPLKQSIGQRLMEPMASTDDGQVRVLGTDQLGRDILSRILHGSRISLAVAFLSVAFAATLGLVFGLTSGYVGRWVDSIIMALVNLQLAFPFMLLALAVVALLGASLLNLIIVFVITGWPIYARTIRAAVLGLKEREFIEASHAMGASHLRILFRHLLPNVISPLTVLASFSVAQMIILEAALGFLGLSVQPPTPTWGNMLADGRQYIQDSWWLSAFPGIAIMITAGAVNFIGDGLRDVFDPTSS